MPCPPKADSCACACMWSSERPRAARRWRAVLALLLAVGVWHPPAPAQAPLPDDAVKAAVIYKVMLFTRWPGAPASAPLTLCVLGRDEVGALLPELEGRRIGERPLRVRGALGREAMQGCDAAYLAASERYRLDDPGTGSGLMTVVDCGLGLCQSGAILSLAVESGRLVFAVDRPRAERQGLEFSAQVLRLARPLPP